MSSKEKALQLTNKFYDDYGDMDWHKAKICATICVDEIINALHVSYNYPDWMLKESTHWNFWQSVKTEIQAL